MAIAAIRNEDEFDRSNQFRVDNARGLVCSGKPFRYGEEFDKSLVSDRRLRQLWLARDLHMIEVQTNGRQSRKLKSVVPPVQPVQEKDPNKSPVENELDELRSQYKKLTGKNGGPNWKAETFRRKILEAEIF